MNDDGLYLYGVTRSRARRGPLSRLGGRRRGLDTLQRVRYRDLDALVRTVPYRVPELHDAQVREHQKTVDRTMRRHTILPAPFGLVFRGRPAVLDFLEQQYAALGEGLSFLDGHWELRLHLRTNGDAAHALDRATRLYAELRPFARAALPLPAGPGCVMSAAYLVDRRTWIEFVERTDDLGRARSDLELDVTGPWPPYDFVTMTL